MEEVLSTGTSPSPTDPPGDGGGHHYTVQGGGVGDCIINHRNIIIIGNSITI